MDRRIFGLETEYGVTFTYRGHRRLSPDDVARFMFRKIVASGRSSNVFLENGSRLYLDVGSHPEYATAECDSLSDLVAQDRAGEELLKDLVASAQQHLIDEGTAGEVQLLKNNTDSSGNSYGCHENYCIERDDDLRRHESFLIPFLVTRQIWAGAGRIVHGTKGSAYQLSQRAEHIWETISSATTRSRPIINTRDEPHADPERFRRLHVILGDSNLSETVTALKVGVTSVLLSMVEDKTTVLRDYTLEHPIRSLREVSNDPFGDQGTKVRLASGREMTAWELQTELFERAEQYVASRSMPTDLVQAVRKWGRILAQIQRDPMVLSTELDWVAKWNLIDAAKARYACSMEDPRLAYLDLMFHDLSSTGLAHRVRGASGLRSIVTDEQVRTAMHQPPQTTRARMRGLFVARAKEKRREYSVDWVHLKLSDHTQRTILLKDPFRATDERFERLLASL
jgi:proteasome accessory factor A